MNIPRVALLLLAGALLAAASRPRRPRFVTRRVLRISRVVSDLPRAETFYRDALGFQPVGRGRSAAAVLAAMGLGDAAAEEVVMRLGAATLALVQFAEPGAVYPSESRSNDLWFQHLAIVVSDMDAAYAHLCQSSDWQPISDGGPQLLPPSNGSVRAFKFRDPDGHPLELIWFSGDFHQSVVAAPASMGNPPGAAGANGDGVAASLFLGVDHSALAIAATWRSLNFYRALGLRVTNRSLNHGPAQDHLDGLQGARVRVTALAPASGARPGLELLGYKPPGRPAGTSSPNNVATDWVTLEVAALRGDAHHAIRDPDGHLLMLVDQGSGLPA